MTVTLYHGDCLEILLTLEAGSVDAVITDPPYNVNLDYGEYKDTRKDYEQWCREWLNQCLSISNYVVLTSGMVNLPLFASFSPTWTMAWLKPNQCSPSALGGFNAWEPVFIYGKPNRRIGHDAFVMSIQTNQKDTGVHPCPKDKKAWTKLVEITTAPGSTILDPFMGSGTTGVACVETGRNFIGIEIDADYFRIAQQRISDAQSRMNGTARKVDSTVDRLPLFE